MQDRDAAVRDACDRAIEATSRGDLSAALRYYEYARRLAPANGEIALALGATRLDLRDPHAAAAFASVATRDDVQAAWYGLAASHHQHGHTDLAGHDLHTLLSRH